MALRLAIFGQAAFGRDVAQALAERGHQIVGVFVPPDRRPERPDPLAVSALENGWPVHRAARFRTRGAAIPEQVEKHRALAADLNILPYTTVILPPEIVDQPALGSLCFHPSLLPAYRGGAAIPWQIILGARETGVSVFRPDAGVDTGPIVIQRGGVVIEAHDTSASLYFDKLYPLGVKAMLEAVQVVESGSAPNDPQPEAGASFQGLVTDEVARIDWSLPAEQLDRLIRGCDPQPGAWTRWDDRPVRFFDCRLEPGGGDAPAGTVLAVENERLMLAARDGRFSVGKLRVGDAKKDSAADAGVPNGARLG